MTAAVLLAAHWLLALVLAVAAVAKLADLPGLRRTLPEFGVPRAATNALALFLPVAELAVALALVLPATARAGAWAAAALFAAFFGAVAWSLARGRHPDCRCFGQLQSAPIGAQTLVRNGVLVAIALVVAVGHVPLRYGSASVVGSPAAPLIPALLLLALLALAGLGGLVLLLWRQQARLLVRLEKLEQNDRPAKRRQGERKRQGLPVGTRAPELELRTLDGNRVSLRRMMPRDRSTLLVFVDPACGPCAALLPDVPKWERAGQRSVLLISRGAAAPNRAMLERHGLPETILLQEHFEALEAFGVPGTPAAVLVNGSGSVGAQLAVGAGAVRSLATEPSPSGERPSSAAKQLAQPA